MVACSPPLSPAAMPSGILGTDSVADSCGGSRRACRRHLGATVARPAGPGSLRPCHNRWSPRARVPVAHPCHRPRHPARPGGHRRDGRPHSPWALAAFPGCPAPRPTGWLRVGARARLGPLRISGFNRFAGDTGEMRWRLLGLIPVVNAAGPDLDQPRCGPRGSSRPITGPKASSSALRSPRLRFSNSSREPRACRPQRSAGARCTAVPVDANAGKW